jgi:deazaflavin-dependent oxidoreductase (nitroreductase family)
VTEAASGPALTVKVNQQTCIGSGVCVYTAPDTFSQDDDAKVVVLDPAGDPPDADGEDYLIVASVGGSPKHPQWYHNLVASQDAEIQVRGEHVPVRARVASDEEKPRLWKILTSFWPNYDVYQSRTDRVIPVVVLSPR